MSKIKKVLLIMSLVVVFVSVFSTVAFAAPAAQSTNTIVNFITGWLFKVGLAVMIFGLVTYFFQKRKKK